MRLAPVTRYFAPDHDAGVHRAGESSRTTHGAMIVLDACRHYVALLTAALASASKADIIAPPAPDARPPPSLPARIATRRNRRSRAPATSSIRWRQRSGALRVRTRRRVPSSPPPTSATTRTRSRRSAERTGSRSAGGCMLRCENGSRCSRLGCWALVEGRGERGHLRVPREIRLLVFDTRMTKVGGTPFERTKLARVRANE